ncbi:integral membrane protein, YkoY family [Mycobacterium basiliense]|uniref:Integral membrane protein, YkoY family n=2 Tax=Mycobacterium basiliense TaxID=2094119 RepID=A0A3S4FUD5_9MYCO|nr:integral membrane protein, YkoY family [Mycobacterium basiliense]
MTVRVTPITATIADLVESSVRGVSQAWLEELLGKDEMYRPADVWAGIVKPTSGRSIPVGARKGPMTTTWIRVFGLSLLVTVAAFSIGYWHGGPTALFLLAVLAVLEVSLSFDNAIINATILKQMSRFWQQMFLTIGILIAVFGMRLVFPLGLVWATAGLNPVHAMNLALHPPPDGAQEFPDGSPSYTTLIAAAHPQIAAFGGMFLLTLFLDFVFNERDIKWLKWIEAPFARVGRLGQVHVMAACLALVVVGPAATGTDDELATVMVAGLLGLVTYLIVNGLSRVFQPVEPGATPPQHGVAGAVGKAGFTLFLYLEVLDASFSLDGVTGAFAITSDPIIIALGLGLVGAMFVRSITIYLVRHDAVDRYIYLEHGAHWAIGALAVIMLMSINHRLQIPEWITASIGVVFIGAAFTNSVVRNRRVAR